jgi:arsenate reductase
MLREMAGERFVVASAGTRPTTIHPLTERVMSLRGLSLQSHRAKTLAEVGDRWDYVITLCDEAFEDCPDFPAKTSLLHWRLDDPSRPRDTEDQQLDAFCRVRDELALQLRRWLAERYERRFR